VDLNIDSMKILGYEFGLEPQGSCGFKSFASIGTKKIKGLEPQGSCGFKFVRPSDKWK